MKGVSRGGAAEQMGSKVQNGQAKLLVRLELLAYPDGDLWYFRFNPRWKQRRSGSPFGQKVPDYRLEMLPNGQLSRLKHARAERLSPTEGVGRVKR